LSYRRQENRRPETERSERFDCDADRASRLRPHVASADDATGRPALHKTVEYCRTNNPTGTRDCRESKPLASDDLRRQSTCDRATEADPDLRLRLPVALR